MERYHDFQIKDHYYWTDVAPEYKTKEEREATKVLEQRCELSSLHAASVKLETINAKNDVGKPLHGNETARECAIAESLANDDDYQQLVEEVDLLNISARQWGIYEDCHPVSGR